MTPSNRTLVALSGRLACIILCITLVRPVSGAIVLTGLVATSTDAAGNRGVHTWNTLPAGGFGDTHNLWITGPNILDPFINGPLNSQVPISLPLDSGIHTFTIFADQYSVVDFTTPFVLNLFLNGESDAPQVSAVAPIDTSSTGPDPLFTAFGGTTSTPAGADVPGANTIFFSDGDMTLTLTSFRWSRPDVESLNRVSTYEAFPNGYHRDGGDDFVGQFTVSVAQVPEPSSLAIFCGMTALYSTCGWWRRRRSTRPSR